MTNRGWTAGLARYCDGHMSEGSGPTRRLQYICMQKHLTLLSYDSSPTAARKKLLLALETGAQPAVTLGDDACRAQFAGDQPLFAQLRRREWVFEPRALALPAGRRGNVFRNPAGPLPITGQTLRWHPGMKLEVAGAVAREMVRRGLKPDGSLELVVSVGNEVKNCFKVTNAQASLRTRAGIACQSSAIRQVVCSDSGWLYSEGQAVPLGAPVPLGTLRFLPAK